MNYSQTAIISALEVIKTTCLSYEDCNDCIFSACDGRCQIVRMTPDAWTLNSTKKEWKPFIEF